MLCDKKDIEMAVANIGYNIVFPAFRRAPGEPETTTGRIIGIHADTRTGLISYKVSVPTPTPDNAGRQRLCYRSIRAEHKILPGLDSEGARLNEAAALRHGLSTRGVTVERLKSIIGKEKKALEQLGIRLRRHEDKLRALLEKG